MKLGDIATVRSGLVLARKKSSESDGVYYPLLNLRSINVEGYIEKEELDAYYASEYLAPEYLTHAGDVVVRLTAPYTAVFIDENTENIVVSSNFIIIRTMPENVLPEYLYWLLNTKGVKQAIYENSTSNMLGAVKAKFFSDFIVKPIDLSDQKRIADLNRLAKRESFLLKKLADEKEKYYERIIHDFQKKQKRGNL